MRHSNHIMIREFVKLLREGAEVPKNPLEAMVADYKANPDKWDDGEGGGDIDDFKEYATLSGTEEAKAHSGDARFEPGGKFHGMTADMFRIVLQQMGVALPPSLMPRTEVPAPKTPKAKKEPRATGVPRGGKNFLRAEDMAETFTEISRQGTEAMMASIKARAENIRPGMSSDAEMERKEALQKVNDDLTRIGQFSGLDLAGADPDDPSVAELMANKETIIQRLVRYIPLTGLFKADSYTDAAEVEKALNMSGVIGAGASLEDLSALSANALGDMTFRALAGTAKGRKATRDINDPSFMADFGAELDALAAALESLDAKPSYAGKTLQVSAGKKNYKVEIPKAVALESLKDPDAIKTFLAGVAADLRDHQARFDIAKKPPVKPTEADFVEKPEDTLADPAEEIEEFVADHTDSNAMAELKNQLGRWVAEKGPDGETVLRNEFDRKLKPQQIFDLVEDQLLKTAEKLHGDEEGAILADLAARWTEVGAIPAAQKIEITLNVLSMLGVIVEPEQVKIMQALGDDLEMNVRAGALGLARDAIEAVNPDLAEKLDPVPEDEDEDEDAADIVLTTLEKAEADASEDAFFDMFMQSAPIKAQLTGLTVDGLEDEGLIKILTGMGVDNVFDALQVLKERQITGEAAPSKDTLKDRKKTLRNYLIELGKQKGLPSPSASVNDLANAVSSGPKLAGFIRSLNTFFDAGITSVNIKKLVTVPEFRVTTKYSSAIRILKALKKLPGVGLSKAEAASIDQAIKDLEAELPQALAAAKSKKKGK